MQRVMKHQNRTIGIAPYGGSAGGWGALKAVADALRGQMSVKQDVIALFKVNQPQGFDCPGCARPIRVTPPLLNFAKTAPRRFPGSHQ